MKKQVKFIFLFFEEEDEEIFLKVQRLIQSAISTDVVVILLLTGNQGNPSSPAEWLLPAAVWAGKAQL